MEFKSWQRRAFCAALLFAVSACTTATITPESAPPPATLAQTYRNVALGAVDATQPEFAYLVPFFREGFVRRLKELNAFDSVSDNPSTPPAAGTLVVTATLTEVDKGDAALRFLIGMGAGREHATTHLIVKSPDSNTLGAFDVRKAYSGGAGIGGVSFLDIDDLVTQVGEQAAQSLVDWSKGQLTATN
jgi:hypothetical protein